MPGKVSHGMFGTPVYRVWGEMVQRCTNPNNQHWSRYGGRGITLCDEWRSFEAFYLDMGDRPGRGYSIDRVDNDAGYSPANCRWATKSEQERNKPKKAGCHSSHKGVSWFASRGKWRAYVIVDGKTKHVGYFETEDQAVSELARRRLK